LYDNRRVYVPEHADERACRHFTAAWSNGLCLYRAWFEDRCLSPMALQAARKQAGNTEAA
jgi:hypothetical protein